MKRPLVLVLLLVVLSFSFPAILRADDSSSGDVNQKLSRVLDNQKQIMATLEEIKSELNIVKIRASSRT